LLFAGLRFLRRLWGAENSHLPSCKHTGSWPAPPSGCGKPSDALNWRAKPLAIGPVYRDQATEPPPQRRATAMSDPRELPDDALAVEVAADEPQGSLLPALARLLLQLAEADAKAPKQATDTVDPDNKV
jgi:hypothetical protein